MQDARAEHLNSLSVQKSDAPSYHHRSQRLTIDLQLISVVCLVCVWHFNRLLVKYLSNQTGTANKSLTADLKWPYSLLCSCFVYSPSSFILQQFCAWNIYTMKDYGQHRRRKDNNASKMAVVVVGEASESEEEEDGASEQEQEDIDHRTVVTIETIANKYVDAAATATAAQTTMTKQVTDSKSSLPQRIGHSRNSTAAANRHTGDDNGHNERSNNDSRRRTSTYSSAGNKILSDSSASHLDGGNGGLNRISKDSLLHNLLKESNAGLKHNLIQLSCTPYATASKDIGRITRHLISSQRSTSSAAALLQKAANDINQLNRSFITLSTFMSINSKLLE